ncbi:MAG TPA: hypothetical protein VF916_04550 [Ktedonobacterales bacterium]
MGFWHLGRSRRRPYGRRPHSHAWVEDPEFWSKQYTPYWWLDPWQRALDRERERTWRSGDLDGYAPRTRAIAMPHGGVRYLFRCPLCQSWRQHLYNVVACSFLCRRCLGLRYRSQYIGRRVDASRERLLEARVILERAEAAIRQQRKKEADRRERRAASARLRRQQATWRARRARLERAELARQRRQDDAYMRGLVRIAAHCDHLDRSVQRLAERAGLKHEVA